MDKNKQVLTATDHKLVDKLHAHHVGLKHYAYSVFIFNSRGQLLLQKRAPHKYHSGNLWTNTCCSHPLAGTPEAAKPFAERRLLEEMGIECNLEYLFTLEYEASCGVLIEHEVDFIYGGFCDKHPSIDRNEVADYAWEHIDAIAQDMEENPGSYTPWFRLLINRHRVELVRYSGAG